MTLHIATEGCCEGHPCDNCKTCQAGRCCRRDNPDYKLPELGEWDGPIYGELGVLNDDGEKVECHCCGEWYLNLATHVWRTHELTPAEYRSIFGLARKCALAGPAHRAVLRSRDYSYFNPNISTLGTLTSEQRSAFASRPYRLQARRERSERYVFNGVLNLPPQGVKKRPFGRASSEYVGVTLWRNKWRAQMVHHGKHFHLGVFDNEESAAAAYDAKARELYGDKARLNFPDVG